jgi:hypothetical protein
METSETSVPTETMEKSVVPQGHSVWETGTPPHSTSLCPYGHDDLLPQNLPGMGGNPCRSNPGDCVTRVICFTLMDADPRR